MTGPKLLAVLLSTAMVAGCTSTGSQEDEMFASVDEADMDIDEGDEEGLISDDGVDPDLADDELGAQANVSASPVDVTDLRYVSTRNGGTVVIRTNGPATYRLREEPSQKQVVLEVANATLPERLRRPYITREFNQMISAINAYQDDGGTTARFVVQLRDSDRIRVEQRGSDIFLAAESAATSDTIALSGADIEDDSVAEKRNLPGYGGSSGMGAVRDGLPMSGVALDELNYSNIKFYGKPISIEVRDMGVRDVISFIAEQSGANLVVSDEVKGSISLKLKQVPWDQSLLLVMKSRNLGYVRQGNVLRIAPLEVLQTETDNARKVVEAQRAAQPLRVRIVPVSYGKVDQLATQVKEFLSQRGKVVADARTSAVIVTDIVENLERATNLIKALDIPPLQVQIEAKVVEAQEGFTRNVGVNWRATGAAIELGGDLSLTPGLAVNQGSPLNGKSLLASLNVGTLDILGSLDASLGLFEQENQVKVISAPRVVTMNNEAANIGQTTQIPISSSVVVNGAVQNTTTFKDVSLSLQVTPQITSDSDVIMQVNIKREYAGAVPAGGDTPPIYSRTAQTRVMVQNGQTAVIGGIYQSDDSTGENGVPGLRKIPILGWLFSSSEKRKEKNELLLFLTPRILNSHEGVVKKEEL